MLFPDTVDEKTLSLFSNICTDSAFDGFYLAGGTALALQIGHRVSIDLDFFSEESFSPDELQERLKAYGKIEIANTSKNTLQSFVGNIKVDFLSHKYPMIKAVEYHNKYRLASLEDISAMKLNAINNRGAKKDFFDVYFLLQKFSLGTLISFYHKKYPEQNDMQVVKSLLYFEDAEEQPNPILIDKSLKWPDIKGKLIEIVNDFLNS